jgi:5'(3')-deoxyribonucleotidase
MKRRFGKKPEPVTARRQLQYVRQQDNDSLEDFAHKVYLLALDGYTKCEDDSLEDIATEAFLRGCKEREAAIKSMEKNPVTLSKAIKCVKTSLANQKAILSRQKRPWLKDKLPFQIQKVLTQRKRKTVICKD